MSNKRETSINVATEKSIFYITIKNPNLNLLLIKSTTCNILTERKHVYSFDQCHLFIPTIKYYLCRNVRFSYENV